MQGDHAVTDEEREWGKAGMGRKGKEDAGSRRKGDTHPLTD
jgi:hypothetical protein